MPSTGGMCRNICRCGGNLDAEGTKQAQMWRALSALPAFVAEKERERQRERKRGREREREREREGERERESVCVCLCVHVYACVCVCAFDRSVTSTCCLLNHVYMLFTEPRLHVVY